MHSIRFRITAITIAAILTSILSVLLASYSTIQTENDRRSVEVMNLISQTTRQSLEKTFEDIEQSVDLVARIASDALDSIKLVENAAAGFYARQQSRTFEQMDAVDAYLSAYCADMQEVFASVANSTQGILAYYYCIMPGISAREQGFFYSKQGKTGFGQREPLPVDKLSRDDMEHNAWFYTPIMRGRPTWVGPYPASSLDDMWVCSYITPIYSSGTLIGLIGMDVPLDAIVAKVSPIRVYKTGFACLFNAEGHTIYHPTLDTDEPSDVLGLPFANQVYESDSNGDHLIRYVVGGKTRQMSYTTLSNGMKLVVTAPSEEINASWCRLATIILMITVGMLAVFITILVLLMRYLTRPLKNLTEAARKLADADYDVVLDYRGKDEIGELTLAFAAMRDQQKRYIEDLNRRILTDTMTGLPNMRHFFKLAQEERARLLGAGRQPVLLYFNLIGMKQYNQQYGFAEGDALIKGIAQILSRHFGPTCTSRFSEDRFMVITDDENLEQTLKTIFEESKSASAHALPLRVGIYPNNVEDVDISTACDRAKYASDRYRGSYVSGRYYFDKGMLEQVESMRYVITHLDQALREHWIKVYYQPIVHAANGMVCDEEALCRWIDPVRGMLSPGQFIPVLESSRLITRLDLYMLDEVLLKLQEQKRKGMRMVPQSLNLSRVDFDACDIVEEITRRVDASGLPRSLLTIEVTESIIGSDFEFMKQQIRRFQDLGFKVWMDDFGSGYSSLDVLQDIRFDLIKLDMRFLHRFDEGNECRVILTELIRLALNLDIDTVCEGVEDADQAAFLREAGCSKLQGYHFSKPRPFEEIEADQTRGQGLTYEDAREADYYAAISRVNLYAPSGIHRSDIGKYGYYLTSVPMAILEWKDGSMGVIRCNRSHRDFMESVIQAQLPDGPVRNFTPEVQPAPEIIRFLLEETQTGEWAMYTDEGIRNGRTLIFARRIAENPVSGAVAFEIVTLVMIS